MKIDKKTQEDRYFEFRNIDSSLYEKSTIPILIKNELPEKDLKILDYGCGFGQLLQALKAEGYTNCYGVDIEKTAIKFCEKNNLRIKKIDLEGLGNPYDFKFNVIILSHIIEHIPKFEIINFLTLIKNKFLEENGKLLIAVPNAQSNTDSYWAYEDWTHSTLFTSGSLFYVLRASGFENIEFLDIDCTLGTKGIKRAIRKILLKMYIFSKNFWNKVTCSSYHKPSIQIFSYEIKCKAY